MLTGVLRNGKRHKVPGLTRFDAETLGAKLFGGGIPSVDTPAHTPTPTTGVTATSPVEVDAWGLPIRLQADKKAELNASLGFTPQAENQPKSAEEIEKQQKRSKYAHSMMELVGVGVASGSVYLGRKACEMRKLEPLQPSKEQVKDLRDCTKETFVEWFGDHEVKPWQMMILLAIGIPVSMVIQSPKKKEEKSPTGQLKSVP